MFSFILILILSLNPTTAKGNPKIPPSSSLKYVNDYSNALSKSTKDYIISLGKELENKTGAQSVVVVMDSLHGYDIESYAYELFNQWGIGQRGKNNGLLIFIAIDDRQWKVEVGIGLESVITDSYSAKVMDQYAVPYFKNNNYDAGIKQAYSVYADKIAKKYGVSLKNNIKVSNTTKTSKKKFNLPAFLFAILIIFILIKLTSDSPRYGRRYRHHHWGHSHHSTGRSIRTGRSSRSSGFGGGRSRGGGSSGRW